MAEKYRPANYEYSESEIAAVGEGMKKLRTYVSDGGSGSVSSTQMEEIVKLIKREHRPEQVACYKAFWDNHHNGRIPVDTFMECMKTLHRSEVLLQWLVNCADKDRNGFISKDEFIHLLEIMILFDSRIATMENVTFEEFSVEADTNRDGRVSVAECVAWLQEKQEAQK